MFTANVVRVADQQLVYYNDTVKTFYIKRCLSSSIDFYKWTLPLAGSLLQEVLIGTNIIQQGFSMNRQTLQIPY